MIYRYLTDRFTFALLSIDGDLTTTQIDRVNVSYDIEIDAHRFRIEILIDGRVFNYSSTVTNELIARSLSDHCPAGALTQIAWQTAEDALYEAQRIKLIRSFDERLEVAADYNEAAYIHHERQGALGDLERHREGARRRRLQDDHRLMYQDHRAYNWGADYGRGGGGGASGPGRLGGLTYYGWDVGAGGGVVNLNGEFGTFYRQSQEELNRSKEAEERGMQLLLDNLSGGQRKQYKRHKWFVVIGGSTGQRYRINYGRQMNIEGIDGSYRRKFGLCFLPSGGLCHGDTMLAQKLALEHDEENALKVANKFD